MRHYALRALATFIIGVFFASAALAADPPAGVAASVKASAHDYHLGAGDKLKITVYGEDTLSGEYLVSGTGKISFPLIGDVDVSGLTIPDLQQTLVDRLADGYLKHPQVTAEVENYRPYYILGEVTKPGEYPYENGLTVLNAVATGGGFTYRANTKKVYIKRANEPAESAVPLTTDTPVEPGDTIRIGERFF
ncbi:MAG TPA: polysaccharide biosynthesis/export family protein [Caulobacteraceae bacterium]|nr:polysaccharide biosynthesis/export family protein [Caulobacteraceae bacterium]